jgi:hypothetical protein
MRLIDLQPEFWRRTDDTHFERVSSIADADGLWFLCPKCFRQNNGSVGTHGVLCWKPTVPQTISPGPGRWNMEGTGFDDLSLVAGSSSVLLTSGCRWHGFVRQGDVTDA